jgi:hypothetical protein
MNRKALATISTFRLEGFLSELANLRNDGAALGRFLAVFGEMLADLPSAKQWYGRDEERTRGQLEALKERYPAAKWRMTRDADMAAPEQQSEFFFEPDEDVNESKRVSDLRSWVRSIWRAPTTNEKQLRALLLHKAVTTSGKAFFLLPSEVSLPGPFSQAVLHLLRSAHRALVCPNPECPTPYFFRKKRRQRYCSESCSGAGQREAKRKWWTAKGEDWRKERNQKKLKQAPSKNKKRRNADGTCKAR